jgi:ubiquinone/menaquinone biosynthesis C-methylase UbiE
MPARNSKKPQPRSKVSDWVSDGLFNHATGELRPGFVINARDVVLDVGCGQGSDALFCAERGAHVIYVDINPAEVEIASSRLAGAGARKLTPIVSDCNPLPVTDGTATKIVAAEVLEHVDDPDQFLRELVRAGAPGALYLLAVPDPTLENLQIGLAAPSHFEKPNHIRIIGRDEFARMVTNAGLVIERRGTYGFYWAIWWLMFWLCKVDIFEPHPMLQSWEKTWRILLSLPNSGPLRKILNEILPKSQYIVARKPGPPAGGPGFVRGAFGFVRALVNRPFPTGASAAEPPRAGTHARLADPVAPVPVDDVLDPKTVGLHDAVESGWFRLERGELFEGFTVTPDDIVLDVGCGRGDYSTVCGRLGAHIIATDIDAANVAEAERRVSETDAASFTPIVGDANPLPLADNSVTRVISTEVIEHVDDPAAFLQELVRVGKPGARYLLAVPDAVQEGIQRQVAPPEFFEKPGPGKGTIRGLSSGHLRTIGREEFEHMATAAGLIVERVHFVGFYWALWFAFFWICNVDFADPRHPLLIQWARTWKTVLDNPDGHKVKSRLDAFMPKSQIIVARKP